MAARFPLSPSLPEAAQAAVVELRARAPGWAIDCFCLVTYDVGVHWRSRNSLPVERDGACAAVIEVAARRLGGACGRDPSGQIRKAERETQDLAAEPPASLPRERARGYVRRDGRGGLLGPARADGVGWVPAGGLGSRS